MLSRYALSQSSALQKQTFAHYLYTTKLKNKMELINQECVSVCFGTVMTSFNDITHPSSCDSRRSVLSQHDLKMFFTWEKASCVFQ